MSFRTEQFFRINDKGERGYYTREEDPTKENSPYTQNGDNGGFLYPAREVRTNDHSGYKTTTLRRGYIRSMRTQADGIEVAVKKCGFQFNPSTLDQSIEQLPGLLNVFQQDASQFAQPIPGNTAFSFELLFDRTMEVNNPRSLNSGSFNVNNPWELSDPSEVGVLRDLATLYATIGQGVSSSLVNDDGTGYLQRVIDLQLERERNSPDVDSSGTSSPGAMTVPDFLDVNIGNTGFLLPVPIRIVFSSLYIVEGFVQSTSTRLVKFSTQMVPLQAKVTLAVDAKYIGFAKERTFLTVALQDEIDQKEEEQAAQTAEVKTVAETMAINVPSLSIYASDTDKTGVEKIGPTFDASVFDKFEMVVNGPIAGTVAPFGEDVTIQSGSWPGDFHSVYQPWNNGTFNSARVNSNIELFGPFDTAPAQDLAFNIWQLKSYISSHPGKSLGVLEMLSDGGKRMTASNYDEFRDMMTQAYGGPVKSPWYARVAASEKYYYIVKFAAALYVNGVRGYGETYKMITPTNYSNFKLSALVHLSWPTVQGSTEGPVVAADNAADSTSRTQPGRTSTGSAYDKGRVR